MKEYLRILKNVLTNGVPKQPTRYDSNGVAVPVENGTVGTFCEVFRHDMSQGFPLLTARKMPWKSIRVELEGFIKGITDKKWFQERGCKFWNEWANPQQVEKELEKLKDHVGDLAEYHGDHDIITDFNEAKEKKQLQADLSDLGPIYGYQWRKFGQIYNNIGTMDSDGIKYGYDQLKYIVNTLKKNPYDRRMVCSAWNPNQLHLSALPACHCMFGVVVYGNKLNLWWVQRSNDFYLGNPSNIASYGLLLLLLAKESGLEPGTLHGTFSDCHLYSNQIDAAKELLTRSEIPLPTVTIPDDWGGIYDWTWDKVNLEGYQCHEALSMAVTV